MHAKFTGGGHFPDNEFCDIIIRVDTKTCARCKTDKPWDQFDKRPNGKPVAYCKPCRKEYAREHYANRSDEYKSRERQRKFALRAQVWNYLLDHPCVDCGEDDPMVLEFDHRDPSLKEYNVSKMVSARIPWDRIIVEINKCDVRCSNCHKRRTAKQFGWYDKLVEYTRS